MNREHFYTLIRTELDKRGWSQRDAQKKIGVQKDVITRLKYGQEINLFSFLTLCNWLNKEVGYSWKEIME